MECKIGSTFLIMHETQKFSFFAQNQLTLTSVLELHMKGLEQNFNQKLV